MPVYRNKNTGKGLFFIHIPRTGGRFVEQILNQNNFYVVGPQNPKIKTNEVIDGVQLCHFHREVYEKYQNINLCCFDIKNIEHVTIFRDPVERFSSSSIVFRNYFEYIGKPMKDSDIIFELENYRSFQSFIKEYQKNITNNWLRSQVDFISKKTHIWKMSNGIDQKFFDWLSKIINVELKIKKEIKYPKLEIEVWDKFELTDKIIQNIKRYYRKDYKILNSLK